MMRKYEVLVWNVDISGPVWVDSTFESTLADVVDRAHTARNELSANPLYADELLVVTVVPAP